VIRAYMAHHQGMTVVALAQRAARRRMRERFHSEPMIQATELLLPERAPARRAVMRPARRR
jgi:cyclic beta-1,2-glucan synthetase